jgi:O-glycosyl hydrolase
MFFRSKRRVCVGLFIFLLVISFISGWTGSQAHAATSTVTVFPQQRYQTIEGWGPSLAWWANIIGGSSDTQRDAVADAIFGSTGLHLNVARFNFGADTPGNVCHNQMRPGGNGISYEPSAGTYSWPENDPQLWMLQAAQARGADLFEGVAYSAPAWMLSNNCTAGGPGGAENLNSAYYDDYVSYLSTITQHFHDIVGVPFRTIDPFNEPSDAWSSTGNQEGMHVSQSTQTILLNKLATQLSTQGVAAYSSISAPDDYSVNESSSDYQAYNSSAQSALTQWNTHTYAGTSTDRTNAYTSIGQQAGKRLWMSEWGTGSQGSTMGAALALSKEILLDETFLHPSAWVIWQAVNSGGGDATDDWGLAYMNSSGAISYPSRYYAMGNYSEFIRPGAVMIGNSNANTLTTYDAGSHTLVIVTTNATSTSASTTYDLSRFSGIGSAATAYQTSASENLAKLSPISIAHNQFSSSIPADSITTFVVPNVTYSGTGAMTEVDDSVQGSGLNQFNYQGSAWQHCTNGCWNDSSGLYNGTTSWDGTANDAVTMQFNGTRLRLFAVKDTNEGIGLVSIDHGPAREVDFYAAKRAGNQLLWESPQLPAGTHTFQLVVSGRKNPLSSANLIAPDRVEIDPGS